jgi:hypothetical protein
MSDKQPNLIFFGLGAAAGVLWLHITVSQLQIQLHDCQTSFQGFKDGVIYGK